MEDTFQIPVTFNGNEHSFDAIIIPSGYIQKIEVDVYGEKVIYEPDEEGNYRAIASSEIIYKDAKTSIALLKEIADVIQSARS